MTGSDFSESIKALHRQIGNLQQQAVDNPALAAKTLPAGLKDLANDLAGLGQSLAKENVLLRTVIDNLPDYIYVKDTASRFVIGNVAVAQVMGAATPDELVGKTDFDFFPEELAAQYYADEQRVIQTGKPLVNRVEAIVDPAGHPGWTLTTKVPVRNTQGEIVGIVGVGRDITERKQAEETLQKLSSAVEQTADTVIITNSNGVIEYVNPAFEKLTGYSKTEAIGRTPGILNSGRHPHSFYDELWQTIRAGRVFQAEFTNRKKNGNLFHQWTTITPIINEQGVITHFVATGRDITRQVEAEAAERERQHRIRRQQETLIRLSTHPALAEGRLAEILPLVARTAADTLAVERVNIWRLVAGGEQLRCLAAYELSVERHSSGNTLDATAYPRYFTALEAAQVIDASDVRQDPRTADLTDVYWQPHGITSALEAPVRLHGKVIGVVCHEHVGPPRMWTPDEINFAGQIADLVGQAFLHVQARRRARELEAAGDILRALNAMPNITQAFPAVAAGLEAITGCSRASLALFDDTGEWFTLYPLDHSSTKLDQAAKVRVSDSAAAKNISEGRYHRTPDLEAELDFLPEKMLYQAGYRSRLNLPLRAEKRVLGSLNLAWTYKNGYNMAHLPLLEQIAAAIALAIERQHLFNETRNRALQQEALNTVIAAAASATGLPELLETTLEQVLQAFQLEKGAVWMSNQRAYRGLTLEMGQTITQITRAKDIDLPAPVAVEDWTAGNLPPYARELAGIMAQAGIMASLVAPIQSKEGRIGGITVVAEKPRPWSEGEIALIEAIGRQLGTAADRLSLLEQTRAQARLVQQIVDTVPPGVLFLDSNGRIELTNPAARQYLRLLGRIKADNVLTHLNGEPLSKFLGPPPPNRPCHEVTTPGPDSQVFEVIARPLETGAAESGWVLVLLDVTESRKLQEQIQAQERLAAVGQLAAGIAHDFNNLLTGITGFAELLQMRVDLPEAGQTYTSRIIKSGEQAAHLISQILDFSRKSVSQEQVLDLVPFLKESIKFLERTIPESIHIVLEITPGEYVVSANPTKIQQIVTNLAVNARDAMPSGGELRFRLSNLSLQPDDPPPNRYIKPGNWVVLTVSDTGVGIPPEIQPRIFEPFFTTKARSEGTGLGLAQVYGIVKQHRGYIDVHSRVKQGTAFNIYLPLLVSPDEEPVEEARPPQIERGRGQTILLVEDEPDVLEVNQTILEDLGYRVLTATNGKQALELYRQQDREIALIITDMVMPDMDGLALLQALQAEYAGVKVMIISGYPLGEETNRILSQSRVSWLQKPVNMAQLARAVSQALA